jgi:hypothetical protein
VATKKPPWYRPPINGVPQSGRANPKSTTPFYGNQLKSLIGPGRSATLARGLFPSQGQSPGGGGNPYSGILNEYLQGAKARFAGDSGADAASRDAAIRRYVISYGQVPDFDKLGISGDALGFMKGAVDDKTRGLAEQNTKEGTSIYARGERANMLANRRIPAALAARGMLRSGQTGADLGDQAQAHKIQGFDTLNEMLGGIEGTVGNFLNAERERANRLAELELQAQMNAAGDWGGDVWGDEPNQNNPQGPANLGRPTRMPWATPRSAGRARGRAYNDRMRARAGRAT